MKDLEFVIDFLLREKKFSVEFRPVKIANLLVTEVRVAYWDGKEIYQHLAVRSFGQTLTECLLMTSLALEEYLNGLGIDWKPKK